MSKPISVKPSAAFFCPVPFLVHAQYLADLRTRIVNTPFLGPLGDAIRDIHTLWESLASDKRIGHVLANEDDRTRAADFVQGFQSWIDTGAPGPIASQPSTVVSFPLLLVTGVCQWCMYLELSHQSQAELVGGPLRVGGVQGYCGGTLSALAVASAADEEELGRRAASMFRVAFMMGLLMSEGETGPEENVPDMVIVRLKYPGQDREFMEMFPGIYASATTNPVTICFAGRRAEIAPLKEHVAANRMFSIQTYPTGTGHDPRNKKFLGDMLSVALEHKSVALPAAEDLRVPVQSNWDGELLKEVGGTPLDMARNVLGNIFCGRCEWYTVVEKLVARLRSDGEGGKPALSVLLLGGYDCVPVEPFHQASLQVSKIDVVLTMRELAQGQAEMASYADDGVAIVGAACRLPGASSLDELWQVLEQGRSMCREVGPELNDRVPLVGNYRTLLDERLTNGRRWFGNFVEDADRFDNELFNISHSEAPWVDPQQRILLELAYEALDSYGHLGHRTTLPSCHEDRDSGSNADEDVGCFLGGTLYEYNEHTSSHAPTAYSAIGTMQAFQAGRISHHFGWRGPAETIDTACSSSLVAISRAVSALRAHECRMALAGGASILAGVNYWLDLARARFLSPTGQCKVFDAAADGYCRADGAGILVLKRLKDAVERGDRILAVIPAAATNQGGLSRGITLPDPGAQTRLYRRVLKSARLQPNDVSYIECHGTGTQAGDPNEVAGLRHVFGTQGGDDDKRECPLIIGSVKGNVGHAEAAAGVCGVFKVLSMLQKAKIPPQASFTTLNPTIGLLDPFSLAIADPSSGARPWDVPRGSTRRALVNSYGAAGSNACVLVCEPPLLQPKSAWWLKQDQQVLGSNVAAWPLLVTAATRASLEANCRVLAQTVRSAKPDVNRLAWTLSEKRKRHQAFRAVFRAGVDHDELAAALQREAESSPVSSTLEPPPQRQHSKRVVLVFGGQSQQSVHLDRHLYDACPALRKHLAECDAILQRLSYPPVVDAMLRQEETSEDAADSDHVDVLLLQTGTFCIQYACAKAWEDSGLVVDAAVGHSFGELTALAFSGALSLEDGIRVVAARAALMQKAWGKEKGKMLAVHAPIDVVEDVVCTANGGDGCLEIACYNSQASHVVVGSADEIERAAAAAVARGVRCQRVDVTHGFHSRFVDGLLPGLASLDDSIVLQAPRLHLELCREERNAAPTHGHIGRHAREPVFFASAIARIADKLGPCAWLEAGTDSPVVAMSKRAIADVNESDAHSFHGFKTKGARLPDMALCDLTMGLWRQGVDCTYWPWIRSTDAGMSPRNIMEPLDLPKYQFSRKAFWTGLTDHASELQTQLNVAVEQLPYADETSSRLDPSVMDTSTSRLPPRLITHECSTSNRFVINVNSSRFCEIVSSHAVCGHPVCPASMYMECIALAVQVSQAEQSAQAPRHHHCLAGPGTALEFSRVSFEKPLCLRPDLQAWVMLEKRSNGTDSASWTFTVESHSTAATTPNVHARGAVHLAPTPDMRPIHALVSDRAAHLGLSPEAERILSGRAYALLGNFVQYSPVLRGIESLTLHGNWFAGVVRTPLAGPPAPHESDRSVLEVADAVLADNFVQVLGLAVNTNSDLVGLGGVGQKAFILAGVDRFTFTPQCRLFRGISRADSWTVVGNYNQATDQSVVGDAYIIDNQAREVVATAVGLRFSQVRLSALRRVLDGLNEPATEEDDAASLVIPVSSRALVNGNDGRRSWEKHHVGPRDVSSSPTPAIPLKLGGTKVSQVATESGSRQQAPLVNVSASKGARADIDRKVLDVVARYTGAAVGQMPLDATMAELGIDSLAIVEFADEMGRLLNTSSFKADKMSDENLHDLLNQCRLVACQIGATGE